jgi:predicted secreted protein
MTWFSAVVVYVIVWWIVFFIVLPFGVRSPHETGEEVPPGHAPSAPVRPRLWLKTAIVTAVATVLWGAVYYAIANDLIAL